MGFNIVREFRESRIQRPDGEYIEYDTINSFRDWSAREWLAAMAMQGLFANHPMLEYYGFQGIPKIAFEIADAMLAYQEKEKKNDL